MVEQEDRVVNHWDTNVTPHLQQHKSEPQT